MATFVLVHGAWHGGWCWRHVADLLRSRGDAVTTPTLTGLGERVHLLSASVDLETHITDLVQHLEFEDLRDVVLVGHSFGGCPITGAADRVPERIARLIYLDAAVLLDGDTMMASLPEEIAQERLQVVKETGSLGMQNPPASAFGISDPGQTKWVESKLTPHPVKTYLSPLRLEKPIGNGLPADYIVCTDPIYGPAEVSRTRAKLAGWQFHDLPTGHDSMVTDPTATGEILETIGTG